MPGTSLFVLETQFTSDSQCHAGRGSEEVVETGTLILDSMPYACPCRRYIIVEWMVCVRVAATLIDQGSGRYLVLFVDLGPGRGHRRSHGNFEKTRHKVTTRRTAFGSEAIA